VAFAEETLGLELYTGQRAVLGDWEAAGKRKALLLLGRRSGKTLLAAVAALHNATVADYSDQLRPSETRFIVIVATREAQARESIRVIRELLDEAPDPDLRALLDVAASSDDEVVFRGANPVVIRALPCSSRSTRGLAASLVIFDEAAHMITTEEGFQAARTVYRALSPSVAQFGDQGYLLLTTTPSWPSGLVYDLWRAGNAGADPDLFVVQRPTWEVNPTITRESLDAEFAADPDSARVEYGAEFMEGGGAFLEAPSVHSCRVEGRTELPPLPGVRYVAAADPAFAAGGDAFTFAVAHRVGEGDDAVFVLDRLHSWRGRHSPLNSDEVLDEIAGIAKAYRVSQVVSDQYAVVPIADGLRRRGIHVVAQPLTSELKSDIFGTLKRAINLGRVELLDHPALAAELVSMEVRPTPSGKPRISAPRGGQVPLPSSCASWWSSTPPLAGPVPGAPGATQTSKSGLSLHWSLQKEPFALTWRHDKGRSGARDRILPGQHG